MRPYFSFFGSKYRVALHYPQPIHPTINEPFAGSADYSLRYPEYQVRLFDADPVSCAVWDYLIHVSPEEIRRLPLVFSHVDELNLRQEAKWLIGFWLNKGTITQATYNDIPDQAATWFVDPPYEVAGRAYKFHDIDYANLGEWCRSRRGQVIVCENEGAGWLPFQPFRTIKGLEGRRGGKKSVEVTWTTDERPTLPSATDMGSVTNRRFFGIACTIQRKRAAGGTPVSDAG